jgi:ferritin-like metal-binding protein YciE
MSDTTLHEKVIDYLQDAHAMEENVLKMLDSMISTTNDAEIVGRLRLHRMETERHEQLLRDRLVALGTKRSLTADVASMAAAMLKGVADQVRSDRPGKNARDGFITECTEIAAYELLERLAERAGDPVTAEIAREIRHDEEEMAHWIAQR